MERNDILDELESMISNFSIGDSKLFYNLRLLDKDDIENDSDRAIIVTPLLDKICDYSMIDLGMDLFELDILNQKIKNSISISLIEQSLKIAQLSNEYVMCLFDQDILHPAVSMTVYKGELQYNQDEYYEMLCNFINYTNYYEVKDRVLDILSIIDNNSVEKYENDFLKCIFPQVKQALSTNNIELILNILSIYIDNKISLESGIVPKISLLNSQILGIINIIKETTYSDLEQDYIEMVENRYLKQKSIFYYYQQQIQKFNIYKEKCKKL